MRGFPLFFLISGVRLGGVEKNNIFHTAASSKNLPVLETEAGENGAKKWYDPNSYRS
jgi:hypothetical protein